MTPLIDLILVWLEKHFPRDVKSENAEECAKNAENAPDLENSH